MFLEQRSGKLREDSLWKRWVDLATRCSFEAVPCHQVSPDIFNRRPNMCEGTQPGMPPACLPENLKMGDAGSIADRARTYIKFLVIDPDSKPGMARDSSWP